MRVLILGGGGMLGHKLWQTLPKRFSDTWVMIRKPRSHYARTGLYDSERVLEGVDAFDFGALEACLARNMPQVILNCIGVTKRHEKANDPITTLTLNSLLPHRLASWAESNRSRLIHFSTDCVFDGKAGGYTESSLTNAEDNYGRTKALGEVTQSRSALTIRSSFIGRELFQGTELLDWFLSQDGKSIRGFEQALYTGISTPTMTRLVSTIIEHHPGLSGLYQVAGPLISKYDLLVAMRKAFGVNVEIARETTTVCKRNLDGERFLAATSFKAPSWSEMLEELAADQAPYRDWRSRNAV